MITIDLVLRYNGWRVWATNSPFIRYCCSLALPKILCCFRKYRTKSATWWTSANHIAPSFTGIGPSDIKKFLG